MNKNLPGEVLKGAFRQDLYFRIAVIPITVPPLREEERRHPGFGQTFFKGICCGAKETSARA